MKSAIVCSDAGKHGPDLVTDLAGLGLAVSHAASCPEIARMMLISEADAVVCYQTVPDVAFFSTISTLGSLSPRPILVFTSDTTPEHAQRAVEAGVHAYVVNGYGARRLLPLLALAEARHRREQFFRSELREMTQRLSEGPLVDRAKAILMGARRMREDEAFQTLHMAAVDARQRVGQVARSVIETALYAEAVNRAGQLRMLSQRLVKLYALVCAGVRAADARHRMRESLDRGEENLASLRRNLPRNAYSDLLEAIDIPWRNLAGRLRARPALGNLAEIDVLAAAVLDQADQMVTALQVEHLARTLRIVGLCGRQRMLSQFMAKEALLASLLGRPPALEGVEAEFAAAMGQLTALAFTTPDITNGLQSASESWVRFQDALQYAELPAGRHAIAALSEELLDQFEKLTACYEHGIQALIG